MRIDVEIVYLQQLMEMLARKTKQRIDGKGFAAMQVAIGHGITKKYLHESIQLKIEEALESGTEKISLSQPKLDILAEFLGEKSFRALRQQIDNNQRNPVLTNCRGNYYCYVRRNDDTAVVMRSPVTIADKEHAIWFELKGPSYVYTGEVALKHGCLFILMRAEKGEKEIHHVYRIGTREQPPVLQGMFSGVSTAFEPICGRTVLIRTEEEFATLTNAALEIADMKRSQNKEQRRLAEYFLSYEANNLKINPVTTFTIDDLGKEK